MVVHLGALRWACLVAVLYMALGVTAESILGSQTDPLGATDVITSVRGPTSGGELPAACTDGAYRRSWGPWREGCPGFVTCEPGFYCDGQDRFPCPVGHFGDAAGSSSPTCSGPCDAGYYCVQVFNNDMQTMQGSTSARQNRCGASDVYCTPGSFAPTSVTEGHYTVSPGGANGDLANATRVGEVLCEIGHYCIDGIKEPCPAGRYGEATGLTSPACSGLCVEGFYCPSGSISPRQKKCSGVTEYCPAGSARPSLVSLGQDSPSGGLNAFFSTGGDGIEGYDDQGGRNSQTQCLLGHYCRGGKAFKCPTGRYGSDRGQTDEQCTGVCEAGYFCPSGSVSPRQLRCGSNDVYCVAGGTAPIPVTPGYYTTGGSFDTRTGQAQCQPGAWCSKGVRFLCPRGYYGSEFGAETSECSGPCEAGYFCDAGSSTPKQHECGAANLYCPEGSYEPQVVIDGYYTVRVVAGVTVETTTGEDFQHPASLSQFQPSALNLYPPDTTSNTGSTVASTVLTEIRLNTAAIRTGERQCEEGYYCIGGERLPCPPGLYGDERQLSSPTCSGVCSEGYYCPLASTRHNQVPCGSSSVYCPAGSFTPTAVREGYYTIGGNDPTTRTGEQICAPGTYCQAGVWVYCPAGSFGATEGLDTPTCTGLCEAGYYCPTGSTSATQLQCGNFTVFCPKGSAAPVPVGAGSYTAGGRNTRIPATQGMFCRANYGVLDTASALYAPVSIEFDFNRYCTGGQIGDNETRSTQIPCEPGFYCVNGLRYECHPATYGSSPSLSDPQCTGTCPAGWYCPWASTSPFERECGGPHVFCPELSGAPTPVSPGHYTAIDRSPNIRTRQVICEPGRYCVGGLKYSCPARRYGATYGLTNALCSGICSPGHFCPIASVSDKQRECGGSALYCPLGSQSPLPVATGFYTTGGDEMVEGRPENTTRDWQQICEPGLYCDGGIKRQCPSRVYGNVSGLSAIDCSGVCPAGYFCPPGTVNAQTHTCGSVFINSTTSGFLEGGGAINGGFSGAGAIAGAQAAGDASLIAWENGVRVRRPQQSKRIESIVSIHSFQLDGGPSSVYCPEGSDFPIAVTSGYYSIGGSGSANDTRTGQFPCEPGWFCVAGRKYPCPAGTYGTTKKLTSRYCSGWCPAGFYCPLASAAPIPCGENSYSTGGSPVCLQCPTLPLPQSTGKHVQERCRDSRLCCNY